MVVSRRPIELTVSLTNVIMYHNGGKSTNTVHQFYPLCLKTNIVHLVKRPKNKIIIFKQMSFSDNWVSRSGDDEKLLPGLEYTQRQLFWVSAANVWCAKYRPKALKLRVLTGVHAPDMFRVRGPFSNMAEFARDFQCPLGSPMNPRAKCQVW